MNENDCCISFAFSKPDPYCEWFLHPGKPGCWGSRSGKRFRTAYSLHNLPFGARMQFDPRDSRPREPSLERLLGKPGHTGCIRCKCHRFWPYATCYERLQISAFSFAISVVPRSNGKKTAKSQNQCSVYSRGLPHSFRQLQKFKLRYLVKKEPKPWAIAPDHDI